MKYYLGTVDGCRKLFPWEKDIPKGLKTEEIDVPTDKEGLMIALQELITEADRAQEKAAKVSSDPEVDRPLRVTGMDEDGHPKVRTAFTVAQVDAMFSRRPEHVQDICYAISKLRGSDLGYVAYQVAAQMLSPITIVEEG